MCSKAVGQRVGCWGLASPLTRKGPVGRPAPTPILPLLRCWLDGTATIGCSPWGAPPSVPRPGPQGPLTDQCVESGETCQPLSPQSPQTTKGPRGLLKVMSIWARNSFPILVPWSGREWAAWPGGWECGQGLPLLPPSLHSPSWKQLPGPGVSWMPQGRGFSRLRATTGLGTTEVWGKMCRAQALPLPHPLQKHQPNSSCQAPNSLSLSCLLYVPGETRNSHMCTHTHLILSPACLLLNYTHPPASQQGSRTRAPSSPGASAFCERGWGAAWA